MSRSLIIVALALILAPLVTAAALAAEKEDAPAHIEPIVQIKDVAPNRDAFKPRGWKTPHVITSHDGAVKIFGEDGAKKLAASVDLAKQTVLVFAWRGSGQDKLTYGVQESYPEQVAFMYQGGRTRDLRPHVHVYALRNNVKWSVNAGGR